MDDLPERRRQGAMERHIQTVLTGIVAALLAWVGVSLLDLRDRTTRLEVQTLNVEALVREGAADRFRLSDWAREKTRIDERYSDLARRVDVLERRR
jgi:hypothetical protein